MTSGALVLRSFVFYIRTHVAVAFGVASAVAVIAGALLVGSSVRASLAALAASRLGRTDFVLTAERPFGEGLGDRVSRGGPTRGSDPENRGQTPLLVLSGAVVHETSSRRANGIQIYGIDRRFFAFHEVAGEPPGGSEVLLSADLEAELGAAVDDTILVRTLRPVDIPLDSLQGRKEDASRTLRLRYRGTLAREALGEFSLAPAQGPVRAVFVGLAALQRDLEQPGRVNTLLLRAAPGLTTLPAVRTTLPSVLTAEDLGLRVAVDQPDATVVIGSAAGLLPDVVAAAVETAAAGESLEITPVLTWLANRMTVSDRSIPYSLVTALGPSAGGDARIAALLSAAGPPPIVLNDWAARDLHAKPGDRLDLEFFRWTDDGRLVTERESFLVAGDVPMQGLAVDPRLAPDYPGITNTNSVADWNPPFPIDLGLVRPVDEDYWRRFRATPKAFIPLAVGQRLWHTRHGQLTSLRLRSLAPAADLDSSAGRVRLAIPRAVDPFLAGFNAIDVRAQAAAASAGATDFALYFTYFSFFLMVSALLLVALFFRLSIEQRLRQIGVLRAAGYSLKAVQWLFLREGLLVAIAGSSLGVLLAIVWAAVMMYGLRTWWVDAVGTTQLQLHADPRALAYGWLGGLAAAALSIAVTIAGLGRHSPRELLTGARDVNVSRRARGALWVMAGSLATSALLTALSITAHVPPAAGFFGAGTLVLIGGLAGFRRWLSRRGAPARTVVGLGLLNASWRPGRSITAAGLLAAAVFLVISVDAFRTEGDAGGSASGTGGFALLAESAVPMVRDPSTIEGREALGLSLGPDDQDLRGVNLIAARLRPGDDTSCLNLYQPKRPRIVGLPDRFIDAGRFVFTGSIAADAADRQNPWRLLRAPVDDGVVPAIADATSLEYVLHAAVGDVITIDSDTARPQRLRIVAALQGSVLQGELLIADRHFLTMFPDTVGYRVLLADVTPASPRRIGEVARVLEERLEPFGLDAQETLSTLEAYHRVENTYLSTFQALGALGLLLGTFGLAAVIARNVIERRRELALLGAAGYTGRQLQILVLAENVALILGGLTIGVVAALIAIVPVLFTRGGGLPRLPLAWLAVVLVISLATAPLTAHRVRRLRFSESLRGD